MTKSTPVPIDGRDVILRDKYRAIVAEYSSEIVEILQAVKYDTEADTARLVKCVRDLDNARQQLLNIEVKLSYEESKSKETRGETDIDFDAMRASHWAPLGRLPNAQGPNGFYGAAAWDELHAAACRMSTFLGHGASCSRRRFAHLGIWRGRRRGHNPGGSVVRSDGRAAAALRAASDLAGRWSARLGSIAGEVTL